MRTVVENRAGVSSVPVDSSTNYVHMSERSSQSRSCFYDFGARQQVRFVSCSEDEKSEFIESLLEEFRK